MTRDVYLISYDSPLFPAHWSLWVPLATEPTLGKRIHVAGDAFTGFVHEFARQYSIASTARKHTLVFLAQVQDIHVGDVIDREGCDNEPVDDIERAALSVPAPGKSLNVTGAERMNKVHILNCQTWMFQFIEALIAADILLESALEVPQKAPRN
ncbi:hypothetical protein BKA93DRAFT_730209 [Sparassis latifolia]